MAIAKPLRPEHGFLDLVIAAVDLPALAEHAHPIRVFEFDGEMIVDVTVLLAAARLPTTQRNRPDRMLAQNPVDDVQVVHVLLDDVIATQPGEVIPVAQLPFHVAPARFAINHPDGAAVPVGPRFDDVANHVVPEPFDGLVVTALMPALRTHGDPEPLLLRQLARLDHQLRSRPVHRRRFLGKNMLARLDRRHHMPRPEMRWFRQNHVVHLRHRQQLLVGIKPGETGILRNHNRILEVPQLIPAHLQPIGKDVGQRHHLDMLVLLFRTCGDILGVVARVRVNDLGVRAEHIQHRTGPPPTTADHPNPDGIVRRRMRRQHKRQLTGHRHSPGRKRGAL